MQLALLSAYNRQMPVQSNQFKLVYWTRPAKSDTYPTFHTLMFYLTTSCIGHESLDAAQDNGLILWDRLHCQAYILIKQKTRMNLAGLLRTCLKLQGLFWVFVFLCVFFFLGGGVVCFTMTGIFFSLNLQV